VTIHRYFPKKPLGGVLGLLNFSRESIEGMIERGYTDACEHDCTANGCVIPKREPQLRTAAAAPLARGLQ
jgi:hypothetical protein